MALVFDNDPAYLEWLEGNPSGYVLNIRAQPAASYAVLHRANCKTISTNRRAPGAYAERSYRKVCAATPDDLRLWLTRHIPDQPGFSKTCGCTRRQA